MIRKIVLQNFMAHESTELVLGDGLNVLVGPNNIGKSTVAVALKTLARNGNSSFVQRHDAKECSVTVTTSDGNTIQWQKKKSPSYVINGEVKDRLGRGGTPPELDETLRLAPVEFEDKDFEPHFGEQKSPIFLINRPPSQIAQFFSTTSDAERLVAMQRLHQRKKGEAQSQLAFLENASLELSRQWEILSNVPLLEQEITELEEQLLLISRVDLEIESLHRYLDQWRNVTVENSRQLQISSRLGELRSIPEFHEDASLTTFLAWYHHSIKESTIHENVACVLTEVSPVPSIQPTDSLDRLCNELQVAYYNDALWRTRSECVSTLAEPTTELPTSELVACIANYKELLRDIEQSLLQTELLKELTEQTEPEDFDSLQLLIDAMCSHIQASEALSSSQTEIDHETDRLDRLLTEWLRMNPSCPTCGSNLTIDMMRKRHLHTGDSSQ